MKITPYRRIRWFLSFHKNLILHTIASKRNQRKANWKGYLASLRRYKKLASSDEIIAFHPCFGDDSSEHFVDYDYIYQNAWAFGLIAKQSPKSHVDVGSQLQFCTLLSQIVPLTNIDIRAVHLDLPGFTSKTGDVRALPFENDSVESISSLCVIEHIELGRYGDSLDADGTRSALNEFKRVLTPGGHLYVSVPIDDENRTYFNSARAFSDEDFRQMLAPLVVTDAKYIYGSEYLDAPKSGYGTACYAATKAIDQVNI